MKVIIDGNEYIKKDDVEYFIGKAIKEDLKDCENEEHQGVMKWI